MKEAHVSKNKIKSSLGSKIFDVCNVIFMCALIVVILIPLLHVVAASFSDPSAYVRHEGLLWKPAGFCLDAYKAVIKNKNIITVCQHDFYCGGGNNHQYCYDLDRSVLSVQKKCHVEWILHDGYRVQHVFSGGMIPHYLVVKGVGLNNSIWALIIPSAISTYNLIIMRTAMVSVPDSLEESAKLDGANQWTILWKIMVPLVKPTIAVICLYYAVTHWNSWFNAMLFIRNKSGYPLQLVLREILLQNDTTAMTAGADDYMISETIQFATIVVATVPILAIYPFIQRYFVKGVMIGAVKG